MKRLLAIFVAVTALAGAAFASARLSAAPSSPTVPSRLPPAAAAGESVLYGHVKSLARTNGRFQLRFDPAWWLTGVAAERAKFEDTGSSEVPNDYYILEEGHRLLTYVVAGTARVTVLTRGRPTTAIAVSELAQIVRGKNPNHRSLLEPKAGFWIRVSPGYPGWVVSLDQQFQP